MLRRQLFTAVLAFIIAAVWFGGAQAQLAGFELAAENEQLQLYFNENTTEIAVLVKSTGHVWYSNPADRQTMETMARGAAKDRLNAQLFIGYYVGNQYITMDTYTGSVIHGQHNVIPIENGVRVEYLIGKEWDDKAYLPLVISKEEFDNLLSYLDSDEDRQFVRDQYAMFTVEPGYVDPDNISILGVDLEALLGDYGIRVEEPRFRATDKRRLIQEYIKAVQEYKGYAALGGVKTEDIAYAFDRTTLMRKWNVMVWDEETLIQLLKDSGYSPDRVIEEHLKYNVTPPEKNLRIFRVAIEYVIDGGELVVRVPSEDVVYPKDVYDAATKKRVTYPLTTIAVLPYFGAANSQEKGYIFVPDGSGALINLNSGKQGVQPYRREVYGRDHASAAVREYSYEMESQVHLPVFGIKHSDRAFLAIMESGEAAATIIAEIAGMSDSYNKVYGSFSYIPNARVYMQSGGAVIYMRDLSIMMYQVRPLLSDIVIRYAFLDESAANYTGMALYYQQYLVDRFGLKKAQDPEVPLLSELIGGIEKVEPVFGVSQNEVKPVTTFTQAETVVEHFLGQGVNNLVVRYNGWLKGGIEHVFPTGLKLESKLGTKQELKDLASNLNAKNVKLYPNVNFLHVFKTTLFDDFIHFRDTARALDRRPAYLNRYDLATHLRIQGEEIPILSIGQLSRVIGKFMDRYAEYGIPALSFDALGRDLYADYKLKESELIDREQAKEKVVDELRKLKQNNMSLMLSGANAYTLPYADFVVEMPLYSRNFEILDQGVPFYQIALRGYIPYAGEPGNLTTRVQTYLLKLLETGAVPYYLLSYSDSTVVKASRFDDLYAINYLDHSDEIMRVYGEVVSVLGPVWNERITGHQSLAVNVYKTTYESGLTVIVNYNSEPVEVMGVEIPAFGYHVLEGGDQLGQEAEEKDF
jgi:hypothetical protein